MALLHSSCAFREQGKLFGLHTRLSHSMKPKPILQEAPLPLAECLKLALCGSMGSTCSFSVLPCEVSQSPQAVLTGERAAGWAP